VLYGSRDRLVLLDAINTWHAFRLLPANTPSGVLAAAVRRAHEALTLELALELGAEQLHDECRRLESTLEELRATQERLLHAERLTTVGRIVGTLIGQATDHLCTLEGFKTTQRRSLADSVLAEELECASEGIDGFAALLRDMLALTEDRPAAAELHPEPLDSLVRRAVSLFAYDPVARHRHVSSLCHSNATVDADRPRLIHVLLNLLRNAAQATQVDGSIRVRTLREDAQGVIEIEDSGSGMSPEVLEHVFTPFFTTKGRAGMGLGLRLSRAAIEAHGGNLSCTSTVGEGTCFRIVLPVVR
jgi:two-component system NtrC family sensor kinase